MLRRPRPAADGSRRVDGVHGVRKDDGLVGGERIQQLFVIADERLLLVHAHAAANRSRPFVFKAEPMKQRNQPGTALVDDAKTLLEKDGHLPRRTRQAFAHIGGQFFFLRPGQVTSPASGFEAPQAVDPVLVVELAPTSDRIVIEVERFGDPLAAPTIVQKQHRIGAARQALLRMAISQQRFQIRALAGRKETAANHPLNRIQKSNRRKPILGSRRSQGIA